jgi:hypothetical protein
VKRIALLLVLCGCSERRRPLAVAGDAGPSVVVVDPIQQKRAPLPLVDEQEPDDDLGHAQPLEPGKGVKGALAAANDKDFFSFIDQMSGQGVVRDGGFDEARIEVSGVKDVDLILEALDGDGKRLWLANDAGAGEAETIPNLAVEPGHTYYLKVTAKSGSGGPYELTVRSAAAPAGDEREPNDDAPHATALEAIADESGFFGRKRDEDWLLLPKLPVENGTLRVELSPVEGVAPSVKLVQGAPPNGKTIAEARGGKGDELRMRNLGVPAGQPWTWLVLKANEGRNAEIRWALRLQNEPPLDGAEREPNDTAEVATPIALAGAARMSGFLWPGDADVYRVTGAPADGLVTVELDGLPGVDLKLERLGADGKSLVKADDGGPGKGEALPPWPGGDFLVRVTARSRDSVFDAPYSLSLSAQAGEPDFEREPNDAAARATAWPDGAATMRGHLAPRGDEDWFRFVAPAGKTRATAEVSGGAPARASVVDEAKKPVPALVAGKNYFVVVKAIGEKSSSPKEPYTVTLRFE